MGRANPSSRRARPSGRFEALPSRDRAAILALRQEIRRSMPALRLPDHPRPFFISHLVKVNRTVEIWGKYGSIFQSRNDVRTSLYTEVRVGSHRSDQTLDGGLDIDLSQKHSYEWTEGPVELEPDALRYAIWRLTQFKYEEALEQYFDKRKLGVQQRLDGRSSGFTREPPFRHYQKQAPIELVAHVSATNPRENKVAARMVDMGWTLFVEDRRALSGQLGHPVVVEPGGSVDVPVAVRFDLVELGAGGARDLFDLAVAIAGQGTVKKDLRLELVPTIETSLGPLAYPAPVVIRRAGAGE